MKHKIDLYGAYKKNDKKASKLNFGTGFFLYILVLLLAVGGIYTFEQLSINNMNKDIQRHQSYVNDATNIEHFTEVQEMKDKLNARLEYNAKVVSVSDVLGDKRKIYSYVINAIEAAQPEHLVVSNIDVAREVVLIDFESTHANAPSMFATRLKRNKSFVEVTYSGYVRSPGSSEVSDDGEKVTTTLSLPTYTGQIRLVLAGGF